MLLRLTPVLRTSLRSTGRTSSRHSFSFPFFTHSPLTRFPFPRTRLFWLVPIAGGLSLYLSSPSDLRIHNLFSSPTIIPCPPSPKQKSPLTPTILSPSEPDLSLPSRILHLLREYLWEPIFTATRFLHLFILFMPVIIASPMLLIGTPNKKLNGDRWGAVWWYGFLVSRMEAAGPTFIKLAQWAASRADLFPSLLCARLGALHSHGKPHSFHHTKRVIERVFQQPFEDVFEQFNEEPIGTGAIAQVYRATLKHDLLPPSYLGPRRSQKSTAKALAMQTPPPSVPTAAVAIKVLHPHVRKTISRDLAIMSFFAQLFTLLPGMEWLSLPEEVDVFGGMMFQQLDLRHEADNLEVFEANFETHHLPVTFPRPLTVWSTTDLLVEEYQNALPLEAFLKNGGGPYDDQVATVGLDAFLNMLLIDNFVHSDLHPGNIMIKFTKPHSTMALLKNLLNSLIHPSATHPTEAHAHLAPDFSHSDAIVSRLRAAEHDPEQWRTELDALSTQGYVPEIIFIDAGLVTTLSATNRRNFLDLFRAIAEFDGYRTGQLMVSRCRTPALAIDPETFALKMQHLVLSVKRKTFSLGQIRISDVLTEVLRAVRAHHVKLEADFVNTVLAVLLLEGIGRQLDPGLDLFKSALPILRQLGRQMAGQEPMGMPSGNLGALLKVWVYMEARELATTAFANVEDLVKYDWIVPSI